jgi:ribosomal peptide maturation radical SAM protein 1
MVMHRDSKKILLISMPFASTNIPSIQLAILESYLKERDIFVKTRHLYLKAAEFYSINNYNSLIFPPNDSYIAQMIFSKYLFPNHWKNNKEKFRKYFNGKICQNNYSFELYIRQTDEFYNWLIGNLDWKNYDIIGFTLNYGQFLPSLAIAKKIKELDSDKKIILGGSRTTGNLGVRVLEAFDFIDFIVSGDGEEALYRLASDYKNHELIPGLIFRKGNDINWNKNVDFFDLNKLSIPSYDSFYVELYEASEGVQQYFHYYGRLPVEISRGCWWNKCSFCNMNLQHKKYREKSVDKIIEEINFLSEKYNILDFQIIGNTLPAKDFNLLFEKIKALDKDFNFVAETRAGQLKSNDYTLMKDAGFTTIQTGVESFSSNYLKKMHKGTRVIDNIAALKYCKENGIKNIYNLIINYPNEDLQDYEETKTNIQLFKQYLDPPALSNLRVLYDSTIHREPDKYNIKSLKSVSIDEVMFPEEFLEKNFNFVYDFERKELFCENDWNSLITNWNKEREDLILEGIKTERNIDKFVLYFVDGGNFIKIYDKRNRDNIQIYLLDNTERSIFLSCIDVISFEKLKEKFPEISENTLHEILNSLMSSNILFIEDGFYLSLPLNYKKCVGKSINNIYSESATKSIYAN